MDRNRSAIIIFCADIRTATALNNALKECRRDTGDFIVTGHLGTDLSLLPWNYLYGHPVVFVPAPSTKSFASVKAYREYILGASVERFSVASNFLLHAAPSCDLQNMADDLDNVAEAELLRTAVHIDDIERPSVFLRNLVNNARGYDEFIQWGKNAGFFAVPKQELSYLQNQPLLSHSSILIRLRRILSQRNLPTLPQNISLAELRCFMVPKMWEKVMLCLVLPIV